MKKKITMKKFPNNHNRLLAVLFPAVSLQNLLNPALLETGVRFENRLKVPTYEQQKHIYENRNAGRKILPLHY